MKQKKTTTKSIILFSDFETLTINSKQYQKQKKTSVYLWGLMDKENNFNYGNSIDEYWRYLLSLRTNLLIYFHNLSFDGVFIYKYLIKKYPTWYKDDLNNANRKTNYWSVFKRNRKIYYIEFVIDKNINNKVKRQYIRFQCTYNLLNSSIEKLGKGLNIEKKKHDDIKWLIDNNYINNENEFYDLGGDWIFENDNDKVKTIFVNYLYDDIFVAKESFYSLCNEIENNRFAFHPKYNKRNLQVKNTLTAASISQKIIKNNIRKYNHIYKDFYLKNLDEYSYFHNFYSGGFVEFNENYQNKHLTNINGYYLDINSSYPFSMTLPLPYGKRLDKKPPFGDYLEYVEIDIEFNIKQKWDNIPILKNNNPKLFRGRYLKNGYGTYYLLKEEFDLIKEIYNIKIKSIKTFYCKAAKYLEPIINELYHLKSNAKNEGEKLTYKIILNSLYGSFGKKAFYPSRIMIPKEMIEKLEKGDLINKNFKVETKSAECWNELGLQSVYCNDLEKISKLKKFPNLLVGATITAYSRINLVKTIMKLGNKNFLYCDTDSILFIWNKSETELKQLINIDDKELGAWKIESKFNQGKILGAKRYVVTKKENENNYKVALAGIKKINYSYKELVENILNDGYEINDAKFELKEDENGLIFIPKNIIISSGKI